MHLSPTHTRTYTKFWPFPKDSLRKTIVTGSIILFAAYGFVRERGIAC